VNVVSSIAGMSRRLPANSRLLASATLLAALLSTGGCTTIVSSTTDKPIEGDPGSRTFGAMIDDQSIETTVAVNIGKADRNLDLAHLTVTSYNGIVLLTGQVINAELRTLAANTAARVKNVRQVRNELEIGANSSLTARSTDTLLTTKIKSKLLGRNDIKDSRVKVVTENGIVFLMGLVTQAEADIASTVAQETSGVQKVVRLFEYVDG
jgi:osmotically-inducible protein OsmY